ncbi:hypothetical protein BKH46_01790 [Helicobacter sp. 12S02634-8]|uniref:hypothetical protein n=1 Tax=Helicobacter sp. 12S02634-8 TaxID=1476199 RepID=UPI000BA7BE71|nr:hypothetical protein [Helicobacter sp. 12S02634-8]PAF48067.1 hypothetical protein BKH46_01790 [Helicobacter sp. 12S02634-8]
MKKVKKWLILWVFLSGVVFGEDFPKLDIERMYKELKHIEPYKTKADTIAEIWEEDSYTKKSLRKDKGLGFFIGLQYLIGSQDDYTTDTGMIGDLYGQFGRLFENKRIFQSVNVKAGYMIPLFYPEKRKPIDESFDDDYSADDHLDTSLLYASPSVSLGYDFKNINLTLGSDLGYLSPKNWSFFVGVYYVYQSNYTNLKPDYIFFSGGKRQTKQVPTTFTNNAVAFDAGIGRLFSKHMRFEIRYRLQANLTKEHYFNSYLNALILGLNYNF